MSIYRCVLDRAVMIETKQGYKHEIDGEEIIFAEIRGAVSGPTLKTFLYPGYYCIFGMTIEPSRLVFLKEGEERSRDLLCEKLKRDAGELACHLIYINQTQDSFVTSIARIFKDSDTNLSHSPFVNDFNHGVSVIADFAARNALKLPLTSVLHKQIGEITPQKKIDDSTYSFPALYMLLGGFWAHKGTRYVEDYRTRQEATARKKALAKLDPASRAAAEEQRILWKEAEEEARLRDEYYAI